MNSNKFSLKNNYGMIAIIMVMIVATVALAVVSTATVISMSNYKMSRDPGAFDQTYYAAEAGLNEGLYRLSLSPYPTTTPYHLTVNNSSVDIEIKPHPTNPYKRILEST